MDSDTGLEEEIRLLKESIAEGKAAVEKEIEGYEIEIERLKDEIKEMQKVEGTFDGQLSAKDSVIAKLEG